MLPSFLHTDSRVRVPGSPGSSEPMALGSPMSSPTSPSKRVSSNQNCLPPYLFRETVTSPVSSPWNTPNTADRSISTFQSPVAFNSPLTHFREAHHSSYNSAANVQSSILSHQTPVKSGGPPIQGLLYSTPILTSPSDVTKFDCSLNMTDRLISEDLSISRLPEQNQSMYTNCSFMSPTQLDPFYTQGEALKSSDQLDESWVTVFGFPPASVSYVLQEFSKYGNIVEQKIPPSGNWMHLKYQSKLQAKKALSKNGKVFGGDIMVGVKMCIELDVMKQSTNVSTVDTSTAMVNDSFQNLSSSVLDPTKPTLRNMRPLTQAYQSPTVSPQKSGGFVTRAFEYLWKLH